ncbi:MAG: hypothetical protein Kilf2KO_27150 [Rhodospirillales bacterium]
MRPAFALLLLTALVAQPTIAAEPEVTPLYEAGMVLREANFRADPSTGQAPLDTFQAGKQVLIVGTTKDSRKRDWYAVSLYDGTRGFIYGKLVAPLPDFPKPPSGLGTTKVGDGVAAAQLVGSHGMTLQHIGPKPWGELIVFDDLGLYFASGQQLGDGQTSVDRLKVEGYVTEIDAKGFTLQGSVSYRITNDGTSSTCDRKGKHRFERIAKSNTWRAKSQAKPCGDWEDVLEVYLRKE